MRARAPRAAPARLPGPRAEAQSVRSVKLMAAHVSPKNGEPAPLVAEDVADIIARVRARRALPCAVRACAAPR